MKSPKLIQIETAWFAEVPRFNAMSGMQRLLEGNFTAAHTATLDGLGVDGQGAHTHYEQMYISSIEPRARLLHRLYQTLR